VTRGTRPKKPSSSRGFAREARGAWGVWGFWGLKTENRKPKIFQAGNNYQIYLFFSCPRGQQTASVGEGGGGSAMSVRTLGCILADASILFPGNFITDATVRQITGGPVAIVRPFVCYRPRDNLGHSTSYTALPGRFSRQQHNHR
jgi:hypothetical protein